MTRVLVTGLNGFLGRYCVGHLLKAGFEVHGISRRDETADMTDRISWHRADCLQSNEVETILQQLKPEYLLHMAWETRHGYFWTAAENALWRNRSRDILERFYQLGGKRAVVTGSCAEYGSPATDCDEAATPLLPTTPYGEAKKLLLRDFETIATTWQGEWAWARLFFPYGPAEDVRRLTPSVIRSILQQSPVRCSHGKQVRDFLMAEDVATALIRLLTGNAVGSFNISSGEAVTIRDWVTKIVERFANAEKIRVEFGEIPANADEPPRLVGSRRKLTAATGWVPTVAAEDGLAKCIAYWKEEYETHHR